MSIRRFAVEEDKAELYSFMITMGQIVDERAKIDPVIAAKVDRMKTLVKAFCPQMDDEVLEGGPQGESPGRVSSG